MEIKTFIAPSGPWSDSDRKFFVENPAKTYRVRSAYESELQGMMMYGYEELIQALRAAAMPKDEIVILVIQIKPGSRIRVPCIPRKKGMLLTSANAQMVPVTYAITARIAGTSPAPLDLRECHPSQLSTAARRHTPVEAPLPREDLDNCAMCLREFDHAEVSPHVMLPGNRFDSVVCNHCVHALPPGARIVAIGMYFKHKPSTGDLDKLKAISEKTSLFNKLSTQ